MNKTVPVRFVFPTLTLALLLSACGDPTPSDTSTKVSSLADTGAGSLRQAVADAKAGDTIKFTTTGTVTLATPIATSKNVTIVADGVTFDAAGKGRVLEVPAGVSVTVKGGTLKGGVGQGEELAAASLGAQAVSKATWGGNLVNRGNLTLDGTTISGGSANNGGGIFNEKGASLTLKNVTVTGNKATVPTPDLDGESTGSGGAIANRGTLVIESGTFSGNTAVYTGGAIRHTLGTLTINGGTFENNSCTNKACGGGVLILGGTSVTTVNGGSFKGNNAEGQGEGGGGVILQSVTTSKLTVAGGTFQNNKSAYGGVIDVYKGGSLSISGGTFENNSASLYGGAFQLGRETTTFTMSGGSVKGNTAGKNGGAINSDSSMTFTGGTIENNSAGESGGAVMAWANTGNKFAILLDGTVVFQNNTAVKTGGGLAIISADTGGITFNFKSGKVSGNTASQAAGGIDLWHTAMTFSGGSIEGNKTVKWGAGMRVGGSTLAFSGGTVSGNMTTGTGNGEGGGGGLQVDAGSKVTMTGGTISNNTARWGGAVQIDDVWQTSPKGEFVLSGGSVTGNKATEWTGGAFNNDGKLTITAGSVTGNSAKTNGGGVYNSKVGVYSQPGGTVSGNTPDNVYTAQ